ncbi:hypothetical protein F4212_01005 [Candidatus Poribacteria bacterium]|nr:hypothetical protein [Candidatus Poribacteria bacterium]
MNIQGIPIDKNTALQLSKNQPHKFQDWAISLIQGLVSNPKKSKDKGIDGFGVMRDTPDNTKKKGIIVQVAGGKGSKKIKFEQLQYAVITHDAAMGILITMDKQNEQAKWKNNIPPVKFGTMTYNSMQFLSIE